MVNNKPAMIVVGASSGLGQRIAADYAARGWRVGVCARRSEPLQQLADSFPSGQVIHTTIDVTAEDSAARFTDFVHSLGGVDTVVYAAGCGWNNPMLDTANDERTVNTNVVGFTRIVNAAFGWFADHGALTRPRGRIAVITSIAGTRGLGISATYSASKRYQSTYLESLEQLARARRVPVDITDIRPGFVDTPLLDTAAHRYPMLMSVDHAARLIERAIDRGRHVAVIDGRWAMVTAVWRRIPRFIWRRMGRMLNDNS